MELVPYALRAMGLRGDFEMAFVCERDPHCRKLIAQCHRRSSKPARVFNDITKRRPADLPDHDLYIAGFPCQPFSVMGAREGLRDSRGRGKIIFRIIDAIALKETSSISARECQRLGYLPPEGIPTDFGTVASHRRRAISGGPPCIGYGSPRVAAAPRASVHCGDPQTSEGTRNQILLAKAYPVLPAGCPAGPPTR
jgi:hypothetical protein